MAADQKIRVRILYFGYLQDKTGREGETIEVADLESLRAYLVEKYEDLPASGYLLALNGETVHGNAILRAGDEIALLPPFAGG